MPTISAPVVAGSTGAGIFRRAQKAVCCGDKSAMARGYEIEARFILKMNVAASNSKIFNFPSLLIQYHPSSRRKRSFAVHPACD